MHTQRTDDGKRLEGFLATCRGATLRRALTEDWLNALIPGIRLLVGCTQGDDLHLEGDVATHTVMVCMAAPIFARRYLDRELDFVERLAMLIHDWKKPVCRRNPMRRPPFPGHEALAAAEVPALAQCIGLTAAEAEQMHFIILNHGLAHEFPYLSRNERRRLVASPYWVSLGLLQAADANSCWCPGGGHLPIHWELFEQEALASSNSEAPAWLELQPYPSGAQFAAPQATTFVQMVYKPNHRL
jgi:hypothetical protein